MLIRRLRRPRVLVLGLILLVLLCGIGWPLGRQLWASYHFRAARGCLDQRDFPAADAHLRACLSVWSEDAATHLLAAQSARRQDRYAEAQRHLARCRHLEGAALERILLRVQRGQLGDNENYLKRTIRPDHPAAALVLEALSQGYVKTDRLASVLECTDLWLQVRPNDAQALFCRGYVFERLRNDHQARDCYQRAVASDPGHDEARLHLGNVLLQGFKEPDEAVQQFEQLRMRRPDDPAVLLGLARCYRLLDRQDEAQRLLDDLLSRHPRMADALAERGYLALAHGHLSEAEDCLRQAVALTPDDREALFNLIRCLAQRGQDKEVRALNVRLRKLEADLARLGTLITEIGVHPDDAALRREAGLICLRYGKDQEGLRWLRSALPATAADLADYYERQGRADEAAGYRRLVTPLPTGERDRGEGERSATRGPKP